jgi:hypothetical protein
MIMKNILPIVMAGVNGIYGLIVAVIIASNIAAVNESTVRPAPSRCPAR